MTLLRTLLLLAVAVLPATVAAQPVSGLYLGLGAGVNLWHDQSSRGLRVRDAEPGAAAVGTFGYGFGNGLRLEVEGNFRTSSLDAIDGPGRRIGSGGAIRNYGAMANILFEFDLRPLGLPPYAVRPYLGGGIGYGWFEIDGASIATGGATYRVNDVDGQLAFQGIAGLALGLEQFVPFLSATVEYRYYGTATATLDIARTSATAAADVPGSLRLRNDNHSVLVGLRYELTRPAPPVAPAAAVAPLAPAEASYLVFFDWDRAELSDRARAVVGEFARRLRPGVPGRIEVAGHADRSGSAAYNQRLSLRRGEAVAAELVARGVARADIAISGFGEQRPLVPTADGVREPQNRRVEIVLR